MLVEVAATRLSLADVQALAPHEVLDVLKDARIDHELSAWFCKHSMTWIIRQQSQVIRHRQPIEQQPAERQDSCAVRSGLRHLGGLGQVRYGPRTLVADLSLHLHCASSMRNARK